MSGLIELAAIVLTGFAVHQHTHSVMNAVAAALVVYAWMPWRPVQR